MNVREDAAVDDYIGTFPLHVRDVLQAIRRALHDAVPGSGEKISYNMPAITHNGRVVAYFAGWERHVSVYPVPDGDDDLQRDIQPYRSAKGTLRFPLDEPVPYELIGRVAARLASR